MYFTNDFRNDIIKPLNDIGISINNSSNKIIIENTIKIIAKELFKYDEKAYLDLLNKYGIF